MTIYTIGYEGVSIESFLRELKRQGIDTVVDVREMPISRKPGFSKTALTNALNLSGLDYVHLAKLGCPKTIRNHYKETGSWQEYTKGYLAYLHTQDAAIASLSALARSSECVLLCYEANYRFCHRSFVANAVRDYCGAAIQHLRASSAKKATSAPLLEAFS